MTRKPRSGRAEAEVLRYITDHCPITVREAADGLYRYSPAQPAAVMRRNFVRDFVDEMLGGFLEPFAAYLAEKPKVSEREITRLQEIITLFRSQIQKDEAKETK